LSCHSQANHRGRGSDAIRHTWFLDLSPSDPQRWGALSVACHPGCRWYLSLCLPFGHALLLVSQLATVYHTIIFIFSSPHFLHLTPTAGSLRVKEHSTAGSLRVKEQSKTKNGRLLAGKGEFYSKFLASKGTLNKYRNSMAILSFRSKGLHDNLILRGQRKLCQNFQPIPFMCKFNHPQFLLLILRHLRRLNHAWFLSQSIANCRKRVNIRNFNYL